MQEEAELRKLKTSEEDLVDLNVFGLNHLTVQVLLWADQSEIVLHILLAALVSQTSLKPF